MSRRVLEGKIIKKSSNKTVAVLVDRWSSFQKYGKSVKRSKKYLVHDEMNSFSVGQDVLISEVPPISRRKRYVVVSKI